MNVRVGINGFGRIGRQVFRILQKEGMEGIEVAAVNDLTDAPTLAHLLKYDSVHGRFNGSIAVKEGAFSVNGRDVAVLSEKDPALLPWKKLGVEIVLEASGVFRKKSSCRSISTRGRARCS